MSKVVVFMNLTLDGVMQAPGGPDEDPEAASSTAAGRYPTPRWKPAEESKAYNGALLLGRRTYEDFYTVCPTEPTTLHCCAKQHPEVCLRQRRSQSRSRGATPRSSRATPRRLWPDSRRRGARISWSSQRRAGPVADCGATSLTSMCS